MIVLGKSVWFSRSAESCSVGTTFRAEEVSQLVVIALFGSAVAKLRPTSKSQLDDMAARLGITSQLQRMNTMRGALATVASEQEIVDVATDTLRHLFPTASGVVSATLAQGGGGAGAGATTTTVSRRSVFAASEKARAALEVGLPDDVGAERLPPLPEEEEASATNKKKPPKQTSVWMVCHDAQRVTIADSRDFSKGIRAFADWEAAVSAGLPCVKAVTVPLTAGPVVVGFVSIFFQVFGAKSDREGLASLREICDAIGGAIFVRRAFALNQGSTRSPVGAGEGSGSGGTAVRSLSQQAGAQEGGEAASASSASASSGGAAQPPAPLSRGSGGSSSFEAMNRIRSRASSGGGGGAVGAPGPPRASISGSAVRRPSFSRSRGGSSSDEGSTRGGAAAAAAAGYPTLNLMMTRKRPAGALPEDDDAVDSTGGAAAAGGGGAGGAPPGGGGAPPEPALPDLEEDEEAATQRLLDWDLDAWHLSDRDVKALMCQMFATLQLVDRFGLDPEAVRAFVEAAAAHYPDNAFHCFRCARPPERGAR